MSKGLKSAVVPALIFALLLLLSASDAWSTSTASPGVVKVQVIGKGRVTGTGIRCGDGASACYAAYSDGTALLLTTSNSASNWSFAGWEDSCLGSCTVHDGDDLTATAVFTKTAGGAVDTSTYSVAIAGNGTVSDGSGSYPIDCSQGAGTGTTCSVVAPTDSVLTVEEQPDPSYLFSGWGGACSGGRPYCTATLSGNTAVTAAFSTATTNTLTLHVDGGGSVSGSGISCSGGSTCTKEESPTSSITLTASAQDGYAFTGWTGDCTGTQTTCTVQMSADRTVTANFDPLVPITITVNGNGKVSGAGVSCGPGPATCLGGAAPNTSVFLTATPATGSSVSWSGCTSPSGTSCRMTVATTPLAVTATFSGGTPPPSTLSLAVDVSGNGYVTSSNGAIYCTAAGGAGCTASLQQNSTVTLTAVPASGATADFDPGWGGDCDFATTTSCTLTMSTAKSVSADFTGSNTTYILSAQVQGTGSGTITGAGLKCASNGGTGCSSPQAATATVTLSASPSGGSTFTGWGGACTGASSTCKVQMTAAKSVTATFATSSPTGHSLTITVVGAGTVKAGGGVCTAPAKQTRVCSQEYAAGAKVTLTATPAKGLTFLGWKGACTGTKTTCALTMTASAAVTASFGVPVLASAGKALVARTSTGYRVTLRYRAAEAGTLKLTATRAGKHFLTRSAHAKVGAGRLVVNLTRRGRYVFTLTLTSKSGRHTVRWTVVR